MLVAVIARLALSPDEVAAGVGDGLDRKWRGSDGKLDEVLAAAFDYSGLGLVQLSSLRRRVERAESFEGTAKGILQALGWSF